MTRIRLQIYMFIHGDTMLTNVINQVIVSDPRYPIRYVPSIHSSAKVDTNTFMCDIQVCCFNRVLCKESCVRTVIHYVLT